MNDPRGIDRTEETPPAQADERGRTARFAGLMAAGIALSRFLGLVRDLLLAYFLGTGMVAEAWLVAFRVPNTLRMFLTEGSLNSAFVPVVNEYLERHPRSEVKRLINAATSSLTAFLLIITLIGFVAAPLLARLIAPGFADEPGKLELTVHLMRWTFFYLFFVGVAALLMGILQSVSDFFTSAISPALFNIVLIGAILAICPLFGPQPEQWVSGLLVGALLSGVLQLAIQLPWLKRHGLVPRPTLLINHPGVRRMGRLMLPTFVGVGVAELAIVANTLLASLLRDGAVAAIEYATRIIQMPYMVCAAALSTAMLPLLSRQSARGESREVSRTVSATLRAVVLVMAPLAVLVVLLATPIVRLLLERGAFGPESTERTALALRYFAPLLVGASVFRIMTAAFFSMQDTRNPVKVATITLVFNVALGVALMGPMDVAGLTLAISLTPCLGSVLLIWILGRRVGGFPWQGWGRTLVVVGVGSSAAILAALGVQHLFPWLSNSATLLDRILQVGVPGFAGLAVYMGVAILSRTPELAFIRRAFFRRSRSSRGS